MRRLRWAAFVWALAVAGATAVALVWGLGLWPDPHLPPDEAAARLRARLGVEWTFVCTPEENDGSLPAGIDYLCQPSRASEVGYWIETDESSITIVAQTG